MNVIDFPLCLKKFFGNAFQAVFVASIEAVSAFSIPYGNDVHIPSVFGKGRLYTVQKGTSAAWNWCDGMKPRICICAGICGGAMRRDL